MQEPQYMRWLVEEKTVLNNGIPVKSYFIDYNEDPVVLDDWALHIRRHYISDDELDRSCKELELSAEEYLRTFKIPQQDDEMGPTARSNTISEILYSDLVEFVYGYNVPRVRQRNMSGKTVSEHGTDVVGYKFYNADKTPSTKDKLIAVEVKAVLSKKDMGVFVSSTTDSSNKDAHRVALTLDYLKNKLRMLNENETAEEIVRFQKKTVKDYDIEYVAGGMTCLKRLSSEDDGEELVIPGVDGNLLKLTSGSKIFFVHGERLMQLAHSVYERCVK